jgi:hypothetical protein
MHLTSCASDLDSQQVDLNQLAKPKVLHAEDPLELCLKLIKANTEALIQSIHCVILYASCLIVSMPYRLSLLS